MSELKLPSWWAQEAQPLLLASRELRGEWQHGSPSSTPATLPLTDRQAKPSRQPRLMNTFCFFTSHITIFIQIARQHNTHGRHLRRAFVAERWVWTPQLFNPSGNPTPLGRWATEAESFVSLPTCSEALFYSQNKATFAIEVWPASSDSTCFHKKVQEGVFSKRCHMWPVYTNLCLSFIVSISPKLNHNYDSQPWKTPTISVLMKKIKHPWFMKAWLVKNFQALCILAFFNEIKMIPSFYPSLDWSLSTRGIWF